MRGFSGPGRVVAGRYELLERIGQGAMGTVWRAKDQVLTRDVAVKEVRLPELMPDRERTILRERTLREARVSAKLSHPGVVTVYDVIEADGIPWIVMELVAARSLDRVLAEDGPLPPGRAASAGMMLLAALASAHAAGIVHRDVKPGNVLLTPDGRAVLTDFGIAAMDGDPALTQTGMVMGTPGFCAPERIRGGPASAASDLWSLGATLYAAVEGHGPFDGHGSPMAVLASIVHSDPPPATSAGPLATVIAALMSKNPAQRPDAARAGKLLADAAAVTGTTAGNGPGAILRSWPVAASPGPVAAGARPVGACARPLFAAASAPGASTRTDPTGFPARITPARPALATTAQADTGQAGTAVAGTAVAGTAVAGTAVVGTAVASTAVASTAQTDPTGFPASAGPAGASARTDPTGFPVVAGPAASPARLGSAGPAASPAGPPPAPSGDSTGTARFLAGGGPDFLLPGTGTAPFAAGAGLAGPPGPGPAPLPVSMGAVPFPASAGEDAGRAGRRGTSPSREGRWLVIALAGAAIVVAGLIAGLLWSRAAGPSASGQAGGAPPLPAGYQWYTRPAPGGGAAGFTMAVPAGWQARQRGKATYLRNPASGGILGVSLVPAGDGPLGQARMLERAARGRAPLARFRRIAIAPSLLRGKIASAWRFTYRQPGTGGIAGLVVVTQATTTSGRPYELMATAPASSWPATRTAFVEAVRTFSPGA